MNKKTCTYCKQRFEPIRPFQKNCLETKCIESNNQKIREKQKKAGRKALKQFNDSDVAVLKRKARKAFNAYIRARDFDLTCISCGHDFKKIYKKDEHVRIRHAGHFRSEGGNQATRYDERNVNVECDWCNIHNHEHLITYRIGLIEKIGLEEVKKLEQMDTMKRWSVEELQEIIAKYKMKIKLMEEVSA